MWWFGRNGVSGFSASSTAEEVTHGIDGAGLTAIVTDGVNITANSLHPGTIVTNLFRYSSIFSGVVNMVGKYVLKNVQQGAATTCYVALHPQVKGVSGQYFSDYNIAQPTAQAKDPELGKKLWEFSMNLISA